MMQLLGHQIILMQPILAYRLEIYRLICGDILERNRTFVSYAVKGKVFSFLYLLFSIAFHVCSLYNKCRLKKNIGNTNRLMYYDVFFRSNDE